MLLYYLDKNKNSKFQNKNILEQSSTSNVKVKKLKKSFTSLISILRTSNITNLSYISILDEKELKTEDFEAYYITLIKLLLRNFDSNTLNSFYNSSRNKFKILTPLLHYTHHSDVMIKNAAKIGLMTIFEKCTGEAMECIISNIIPQHVIGIIAYLKQNAVDIQMFSEKCDKIKLQNACRCYEEEIEYIDDLLNMNNVINQLIIPSILNDFIVSFVLVAVINIKIEIEYTSPLFCRNALYLLTKLFEIITNATLKEKMIELILQQEKVLHAFENKQNQTLQLSHSLQLILIENKLQVDVQYILHILYTVQSYISSEPYKLFLFYNTFLCTLIKVFWFNDLDHIKMTLLTLLLEPLIKKDTVTINTNWSNLQEILSQFLKVSYVEICQNIKNENVLTLAIIIDKEYEAFINIKNNLRRFLNEENCLLLEKYTIINNSVENIKKSVTYLFYIRYLLLKLKKHNEILLPIMENKEQIGKFLYIDKCISCKKLVHDNVYISKHVIKLTNSQLLVLQILENEPEKKGIIIFNSYYKDITWLKHTNYILSLFESTECAQMHTKAYIKTSYVQLKFKYSEELHAIFKLLTDAKIKQIQIIKKKIQDLFEI